MSVLNKQRSPSPGFLRPGHLRSLILNATLLACVVSFFFGHGPFLWVMNVFAYQIPSFPGVDLLRSTPPLQNTITTLTQLPHTVQSPFQSGVSRSTDPASVTTPPFSETTIFTRTTPPPPPPTKAPSQPGVYSQTVPAQNTSTPTTKLGSSSVSSKQSKYAITISTTIPHSPSQLPPPNDTSTDGRVEISKENSVYGKSTCRYLYGTGENICNMIDRVGKIALATNTSGASEYNKGEWVRNCNAEILSRVYPNNTVSPVEAWRYAYNISRNETRYALFTEGGVRYHFPCFNESDKTRSAQKADTLNFYWQPDSCGLHSFDAQNMQRIFANHNILFVGDSLLGQLARSIRELSGLSEYIERPNINSAGGSFIAKRGDSTMRFIKSFTLINHRNLQVMPPDIYELCASKEPRLLRDFPGGNQTEIEAENGRIRQLQKRRNDYCPPRHDHKHLLSHASWARNLTGVDVLIFNTGHHWNREGFDNYKKMVHNVVKYLAENFSGKVVFMSTSPGHVECMKYREPTAKPIPNPSLLDVYHWEGPKEHESIWGREFAQTPLVSNFTYFHVDGMSLLRPDGHPTEQDCLHYCVPGVPDTWSQALYNLLLQFLA
eukprot:comp4598_c0_seq1/m.803 comp4598_c0_seq1/g.803  ORF comp4598_c0_seq1/g.803 comp4598_c0_seq1/m.803 type:complete len:605 (-) comp4598_c0_seq1:246-2060(-)